MSEHQTFAVRDVDWSTLEITALQSKQAISIRIDCDVLEFFKGLGPGYQRRINAVLRHYMRERKKANE